MSEQFIMFLVAQFATAAGIYAAIRADLQELKFRATSAEKRLDRMERVK